MNRPTAGDVSDGPAEIPKVLAIQRCPIVMSPSSSSASPKLKMATSIQPGDHKTYMRLALSLAQKSPPKPTNYRVGALVVHVPSNTILATGYTLELEGNTHAEQCCFIKLAQQHGVPVEKLNEVLPSNLALYTTVEPCSKRLSGNLPCVERVLRLAACIKTVYVGILEPEKFVQENTGRKFLKDAGIAVVHVEGMEKEILEVATAGHVKE